jgi:hypothetical protein
MVQSSRVHDDLAHADELVGAARKVLAITVDRRVCQFGRSRALRDATRMSRGFGACSRCVRWLPSA